MNISEAMQAWVKGRGEGVTTDQFIEALGRISEKVKELGGESDFLDSTAEISLEAEAVEPLASFLILAEKARDLVGYAEAITDETFDKFLSRFERAFKTLNGLFNEYAEDHPMEATENGFIAKSGKF